MWLLCGGCVPSDAARIVSTIVVCFPCGWVGEFDSPLHLCINIILRNVVKRITLISSYFYTPKHRKYSILILTLLNALRKSSQWFKKSDLKHCLQADISLSWKQ